MDDVIPAKPHQIETFIADAYKAINLLNAARKEACAEYNERIRKLRDLASSLEDQRSINGDMLPPGFGINPELQRLLSDPLGNI